MFEDQTPQTANWKVMAALGAAATAGLGGLGFYAEHQHKIASDLAVQNQQVTSQLASTRQDVERLTNSVNTLMARADSQPAPARNVSAPSNPVHKKHVEDPGLKKLQSQVDAQGKAIDETRTQIAGTQDQLNSTRTELTGSIARTHDDLVMLQRKGERTYYEFEISKSKQFSHEGPVGIRLKKANTKHDYADLELMLDDRLLSQKHVNIYQPVMFFTPDMPQPLEIVINSIGKDRIHGYVSSPKYRQSELATTQAATSTQGGGSAATTSSASSTRQKLPTPQ